MPNGYQAPTPAELDPYFPEYQVTDFIAQGGMGAVFKATEVMLDRPVAIKILPYELGLKPEFSDSFAHEAKIMAKLNHPNLVKVYSFGNMSGMFYIVMEYVSGKSLYSTAKGKQVRMHEAGRLISSICRGLHHAHKQGLIHRDIKPANILINARAEPKIVDFGLAHSLGNEGPASMMFGTKGYAAPEITDSPDSVDLRADIYSAGIMLYELLTGQRPSKPYVPASTISDSHPDFDPIIEKAIDPKPHLRYNSAFTMAEEIEELVKQLEEEKYENMKAERTVHLHTHAQPLPSEKSKFMSHLAFYLTLIIASIALFATIMIFIG